MGVFIDNFGSVGRDEDLRSGTFWGSGGAALSLTGRAEGEGGIPRVSRGVRVPLLLRPPGTGGRSSGTGDDIVLDCCRRGYECWCSRLCCRLVQCRRKQGLDVLCRAMT
jgi:hypothetical protein